MSFNLTERVMFGYYGGNPMKKQVLLVLAAYADNNGRNAYPAVETIAGIIECSERTVQNKFEELEAEGLIVKRETERWLEVRKDKRPNPWMINVDAIQNVSRKDVRGHLKNLEELRSKDEGRGAGGSPRGVQEVHPTQLGDSVNIPISSSLPSIQSEPPALASPTNYPHAEEEKPLQNEVQEGREDEEESIPFTETQSPTENGSSLQAGNLYADQIKADSVGPEEMAERHLASLNLPWTPHVTPYLIARTSYPDVNVDMVIVDYIDWCARNGTERSVTGWNRFVKNENRREQEAKSNAAREERRSRTWVAKHFGADY